MASWPHLSVAWVSVALALGLASSDAFVTPARAVRHGLGQAQVSRTARSYVSISMSSPGASSTVIKEGAVIVGGGPSGLATALMLAKRGWTDISIIEKTPSADFFDPRVAFVYNIDRRGQDFLDAHGLTEKLAAVSVDSRDFTLTRMPAEGERKEITLPVIDNTRPTAYWLPRSVFQQLLYSEVEAKYPSQVKVFYSATCDSIERVQGGSGIEVRASLHGKETGEKVFRPRLLVGADGLKSMVRQRLRSWDEEATGASTGQGTSSCKGQGRFDMRKQPSGSSGLRYKVLSMPPSFRLGYNNDEERARCDKAYAILSKFTDGKRAIQIGILPWGQPGGERAESPRGGNFITVPGHPLWEVNTLEGIKAFLAENYPQTPVAEGISDTELSRFAQSEGGRFPDPQYCPGLQWVVGSSEGGGVAGGGSPSAMEGLESAGGVALLGDAIHAFPPDLGQGVNSALEDVVVLERALESCGDGVKTALPAYEEARAEDSKALVRLCQIGYPWQYRQPATIQSRLWTLNFLLRSSFLNKFFPKIFGQQVFKMIQTEHDKRYSEILASATRTTRRICFTAATIALAVIFRRKIDVAARPIVTGVASLVSRAF